MKKEEGGGKVVFHQEIRREVLQYRIKSEGGAATLVCLPFFLVEL